MKLETFIPHPYQTLEETDRTQIDPITYARYIQQYHADSANDLDCSKIIYKSDGLDVVGFLIKPRFLKPNTRYPLIIYNRGGSGESGKITVAALCRRIFPFVRAGYVVLASQYRGSDGGQGRDELGGADINDVLNLMPIARELPYIDPERLFMVGFSRGAIMTYRALALGIPVKAAAVMAGVSDLFLFERMRPDAIPLLQEFIPNYGSHKQAELAKRSVICWPEAIQVPIALFHGDADPIVDVRSSHELYQSLQALGKPCKLTVYPGGDHFLVPHVEDIVARTVDWFSSSI